MQDWVRIQRYRLNTQSNKFAEIRQKVNIWKNELTLGEKIAGGTIFINFMVLCAWRIKTFRPILFKHFLSEVSTKKVALTPMILSSFSHSAPLHFAMNMYVIYSFSNLATALLGPEQLIGLFLSASAVSSLTSLACRLISGISNPSLGASGAIFAILGYICTSRPETELLLFFIPITAGNVIKLAILVDSIGIIARWRFIDHAAHLGGSLFGVWYAHYGEKLFHRYKRPIVDVWLRVRKSDDE